MSRVATMSRVTMTSRVTTTTEMRMIWRVVVDHPDEGGGSKLCEMVGMSRGKDSSYFSTQFRIYPDSEKFIGEI